MIAFPGARRPLLRLLALVVLALMAAPAAAQREGSDLAQLARDVGRVEDLRAIKDLQRRYAQYAQFGMWTEIGALFAPTAQFTFDGQIRQGQTATGPDEIAAFLRTRYGGGHDGIAFGEHWPSRLDEALASARFLIPILSPSFITSEPCRDELRKFLAHERAVDGDPSVEAARRRGEAYLLERRLFRRRSTGAVIDPAWLRFAFPPWYHYDVLRALEHLRSAGDRPDPRVAEAVGPACVTS